MGENICWGPTSIYIRSAIFINDIFLFLQKCDLANYADDSTMYTSEKRVSTIIDSLRHEFTILNGFTITSWFLTQKNVHLCC